MESTLYENHPNDSRITESGDTAPTMSSRFGTGGGNVPLVREPIAYDSHPMDSRVTPVDGPVQTLSRKFGMEYDPNTILIRQPMDVFCQGYRPHFKGDAPTWKKANVSNTLNTFDIGETRCKELVAEKETNMEETKYVVRRITPTECERLQGFPTKGEVGPDGRVLERDYTDIPWPGADHAPDSHRYKALGNSFSTSVVRLIGESIMEALENPITEDTSEKIPYQTDLFGF